MVRGGEHRNIKLMSMKAICLNSEGRKSYLPTPASTHTQAAKYFAFRVSHTEVTDGFVGRHF